MNQLFYIDEEERGIGKSYALAKFCVGLSLLDNKNLLIVTAPTFRQGKIVLKYISYVLNDHLIFHKTETQVDSMSVFFGIRREVKAVPINDAIAYTNADIILDEHKTIPDDIMRPLIEGHSPMQDIRQYNLFELLEPIPIG